jgi:hypothetical protein
MNTMSIPGFTGGISVYRNASFYNATARSSFYSVDCNGVGLAMTIVEVHGCPPGSYNLDDGVCLNPDDFWGSGGGNGGGGGNSQHSPDKDSSGGGNTRGGGSTGSETSQTNCSNPMTLYERDGCIWKDDCRYEHYGNTPSRCCRNKENQCLTDCDERFSTGIYHTKCTNDCYRSLRICKS